MLVSRAPLCSPEATGKLVSSPAFPPPWEALPPADADAFTSTGLPLESTEDAGKCSLLMNFKKHKTYAIAGSIFTYAILRCTEEQTAFYSSVIDLVSLTGLHPVNIRRGKN